MADEPPPLDRGDRDDEPSSAEESSGGETEGAGKDDETVTSPFDKEHIRFAIADETLAVRLDGTRIGRGRIPTDVAAPFIHRLHELLHALGGYAQSRALGKTGPLPTLTGAAGVSLAGLTGGSATLHFARGEGAEEEQLIITPEGGIASAMEQAIDYLLELLDAAADADEDRLTRRLHEAPARVGQEFVAFLDVVSRNEVTTTWSRDDREVRLPVQNAVRTRLDLERIADEQSEDVTRVGYLYEADARAHTFRLEQMEGGTLTGAFPEEFAETVRAAWGKVARIRLRIIRKRINRKREFEPEVVELLDVLALYEVGEEIPDE